MLWNRAFQWYQPLCCVMRSGVRCCFWLNLSFDLSLHKSCLNFWLKSKIRLKSETAPHPRWSQTVMSRYYRQAWNPLQLLSLWSTEWRHYQNVSLKILLSDMPSSWTLQGITHKWWTDLGLWYCWVGHKINCKFLMKFTFIPPAKS